MEFPKGQGRPVVLFDLDGTLLPMEMKDFERDYFRRLCRAFPELPPEELVAAIWAGTRAMVQNDGSRTNREAFAAAFLTASGLDYLADEERYLDFYRTDFQNCVEVCQVSGLSREIVEILREKGYTVAIATNPIFPRIATESRLRWLGLAPEMFPLVTSFDDSHYAKPNPDYYREVCRRLGVQPEDCVMIGNDVEEDGCARSLGMEVLLVRDHLLNPRGLPTEDFPLGTLEDVKEWALSLPRR